MVESVKYALYSGEKLCVAKEGQRSRHIYNSTEHPPPITLLRLTAVPLNDCEPISTGITNQKWVPSRYKSCFGKARKDWPGMSYANCNKIVLTVCGGVIACLSCLNTFGILTSPKDVTSLVSNRAAGQPPLPSMEGPIGS